MQRLYGMELMPVFKAEQRLLVTVLITLNHGQVTRTRPEPVALSKLLHRANGRTGTIGSLVIRTAQRSPPFNNRVLCCENDEGAVNSQNIYTLLAELLARPIGKLPFNFQI
ncbi:hypothetical protein TNCV_4445901 [Trichonephila clavipes]|nr:hypothetical protein TNCV_4445901 [Trichonephila clavipes]